MSDNKIEKLYRGSIKYTDDEQLTLTRAQQHVLGAIRNVCRMRGQWCTLKEGLKELDDLSFCDDTREELEEAERDFAKIVAELEKKGFLISK